MAPTYASLSALEPRCNGTDERAGADCNAAVRRLCVAQGCTSDGFGIEGATGATLDATCLSGDGYDTTYRALQRWDPACDGVIDRDGSHCAHAIDSYCVAKGEAGGFGPVAVLGDTVSVTCVPTARVEVQNTALVAVPYLAPGCNLAADPWSSACRRGVQSVCRSRGDAGGVGSMVVSGDGVRVELTCIRSRP
jgi:hypothetical protein